MFFVLEAEIFLFSAMLYSSKERDELEFKEGMILLAPIILYPVLAVLLPVILYFIKRKFIWLSLILTVIIDGIVYWDEFSYYEARPLMIIFTLAQLVVMVIVILVLKTVVPKTKK